MLDAAIADVDSVVVLVEQDQVCERCADGDQQHHDNGEEFVVFVLGIVAVDGVVGPQRRSRVARDGLAVERREDFRAQGGINGKGDDENAGNERVRALAHAGDESVAGRGQAPFHHVHDYRQEHEPEEAQRRDDERGVEIEIDVAVHGHPAEEVDIEKRQARQEILEDGREVHRVHLLEQRHDLAEVHHDLAFRYEATLHALHVHLHLAAEAPL